MSGPAFHITTYGCQMNERDTEIMAELLVRKGMAKAASLEDAQVVLVNTCHIREHAEQRALSLLGRLAEWRKARPDRILALTGCVAEAQGRAVRQRFPQVDIVLGPAKLPRLPELIDRVWETNLPQFATGVADAVGVPELTGEHPAGFKAWVKIMEGCDHQCTFCVVPAVRGRERNRPFDEIVGEVEGLVARGVVEVTLLGQTVNAYGKAGGPQRDFAALLRRLDRVPGLRRLRFTSSHPVHHTDRVLTAFGECATLCEHMHLPVQSGSDGQLKRMWRGYTAARYLEIVARGRALVPTLAVTTDLIVGFPGESEEDFLATLELVRAADFDGAYSFKYSPRPGTPGAAMADQVAEDVKDVRLARLNALLETHSRRHNEALVGTTVEALVEGAREGAASWQGRLRTNKLVYFPPVAGVLAGQLVPVRVLGAGSWTLTGEVAAAPAGSAEPRPAVAALPV